MFGGARKAALLGDRDECGELRELGAAHALPLALRGAAYGGRAVHVPKRACLCGGDDDVHCSILRV